MKEQEFKGQIFSLLYYYTDQDPMRAQIYHNETDDVIMEKFVTTPSEYKAMYGMWLFHDKVFDIKEYQEIDAISLSM